MHELRITRASVADAATSKTAKARQHGEYRSGIVPSGAMPLAKVTDVGPVRWDIPPCCEMLALHLFARDILPLRCCGMLQKRSNAESLPQSVGPFDQNLHSLVSVCSLPPPVCGGCLLSLSASVPRLPSDPRMLRLPLISPATGTVFSLRYDTGPTGLSKAPLREQGTAEGTPAKKVCCRFDSPSAVRWGRRTERPAGGCRRHREVAASGGRA